MTVILRPKMKTWRGEDACYVHHKLDGLLMQVEKAETGLVRVYTRHPTDVTDKLRDTAWYGHVVRHVPRGSVILGELWRPGHRASDVKSDWAGCKFTVFAVPVGLPASAPLETVGDWCKECCLEFAYWEKYHDWKQEDLLTCLPPDVEGYVLKDGNLTNWMKAKPERTIDLIVRGTKPGWGAFLGFVGSLEMATAEGFPVCSTSGMTWAERREITRAGRDVIGRVAEVCYQYIGSKGCLRHPRFVRWRDDKPPEECTADQDEALVEYWQREKQ